MAGEVGQIRLARFGPVGYGKAGSSEGFCSGSGITQLAKSKVMEQLQMGLRPAFCPTIADLPRLNAKVVAHAADRGDTLAKEIYTIRGHHLGMGLAVLIDILNPEMIVLGSIFQRSEHLLRPAMEKVLEQESLCRPYQSCRIAPAGLGENIGDYAALSLALSRGLVHNVIDSREGACTYKTDSTRLTNNP